jgi:hypothetical protein
MSQLIVSTSLPPPSIFKLFGKATTDASYTKYLSSPLHIIADDGHKLLVSDILTSPRLCLLLILNLFRYNFS